jgi:DNA topoisomerase VI subunit B
MTSYLYINTILKKQITVKKDRDDEQTKCLKEVQVIPEYVSIRIFKPPLQEGSHRIIDQIPETKQQICPFPYARYVFNKIQGLRI